VELPPKINRHQAKNNSWENIVPVGIVLSELEECEKKMIVQR